MAESSIKPESEPSDTIKIEDSSGLSGDEIRKIAQNPDKDERDINFESSTDEYDWIELTSGEWLKGEFKAMYKKHFARFIRPRWECIRKPRAYLN